MFGTFAYEASLGINAAGVDVPAVTDPQTTIQNGHFIFLTQQQLMLAYYFATSATKAQIVTPHYRAVVLPFIRPLERAALPPNRPLYANLGQYFPKIPQGEEVQILGSNNLGAATEVSVCFLWVGDGQLQIPPGPIWTANFSSAITLVANGWASANITFTQTLPQGQYAIVGMSAVCVNAAAVRLILPGYSNRPGVIAMQNQGQYGGDEFMAGNLGEFGRFWNTAQPLAEAFGITAGAQTVDGYLELVKVA